jgi:glutathione S-transferase
MADLKGAGDAMLTLHYHPFSSYCQKALIALYERDVAFTPHLVDLADADARAAFEAIWPLRRFPVLVDEATGRVVPESTTIIDYLDLHRPGPAPLVPPDPDQALEARLWDRLFDNYVHLPMQRIVGDRLRPADAQDSHGVAGARGLLDMSYDLLEERLAGRAWATGDAFTLADCAAAPALFYADWVHPFRVGRPVLAAYFQRLLDRPSFARAVEEARPWRAFFPGGAPEA